MGWHSVHSVLLPLFGVLYQRQIVDDDDDCGAFGGRRIDRGNRSTRRKPVPLPLCAPQIPHDLTRTRTRAAAVGSRRLTSWHHVFLERSGRCALFARLLGFGVRGVEIFRYLSTRLVMHFSVSSDTTVRVSEGLFLSNKLSSNKASV
jgi:hypothetical protein